eukprot:TRINITY_DN15915_c0_g1_i2.p1 TRINITY_DN15915_c0_g1~~TRINITY_DN15915_c0_g1_i2.p1  ORF type:complete len:463 (-),score=86.36 TRINITY_DN15915_c0_g1_i2:147-1535(-)
MCIRDRCKVCEELRPPFSHHCRTCDACVADFDHHCHVLGVCIGRGNRPFFITMLAVGATPQVCQLWGTIVVAVFQHEYAREPFTWWMTLKFGCPLLVFFLASGCLGCFSVTQMCLYAVGLSQHKSQDQAHKKWPLFCSKPEGKTPSPHPESDSDDEELGNKPAGDHGHSHGGKPCAGHGHSHDSAVPAVPSKPPVPILEAFEGFCARVLPARAQRRRCLHAVLVLGIALGGVAVELRCATTPSVYMYCLLAVGAVFSAICCTALHKPQPVAQPTGDASVGYCEGCRLEQPALTAHCSACEVCVAGRVQHCSLFDTCIGSNNRVYLIALCVCAIVCTVPQLARVAYYACTSARFDLLEAVRPVVTGAIELRGEHKMATLAWSAGQLLLRVLSVPIQVGYIFSAGAVFWGCGIVLWQQYMWTEYASGGLQYPRAEEITWLAGKKNWGLRVPADDGATKRLLVEF